MAERKKWSVYILLMLVPFVVTGVAVWIGIRDVSPTTSGLGLLPAGTRALVVSRSPQSLSLLSRTHFLSTQCIMRFTIRLYLKQ